MGEARSALLIGIGRYDNGDDLKSLAGPRVDVQSMKSVLADPVAGAYRVETLEDVDSSTACSHLEDFLRERSENETCLIYFSGHGFIDAKGALYLCTTNASFRRPKTSTIPADFISGLIDDCQSKRVVLVLDCCYSGNYDGAAKSGDIVQPQFGGTGFGRVVLTAGAENQLAWDNGDQGSLFSRHISEGIRSGGADTDGDGRITVQELYDYVYRKVVSERPNQRPGKNTYRESGPSFLIAESPVKKVEQIPAWLHHELSSSVAETRLNAIKALDDLVLTRPNTRELVRERLRAFLEDDSVRVQRAAHELLIRQNSSGSVPLPMPPRVQAPAAARQSAEPDPPPSPPEPPGPDTTNPPSDLPTLNAEIGVWGAFSAAGVLGLILIPMASGVLRPDYAAYFGGATTIAAFLTFLGVRYPRAKKRGIFSMPSWWMGAVALFISFVILVNARSGGGAGFLLFAVVNVAGFTCLLHSTLRLRFLPSSVFAILVAAVLFFALGSVMAFGLAYAGMVLVAAVVLVPMIAILGNWSRSRFVKAHGG